MQFVARGPDIPEVLLEAHEAGRVVFFCGAGISYAAGLPSFQGLVDEIYRISGTTRTAIEEQAYQNKQFDAVLDLLERRLPGDRIAVRTALSAALQPNLRKKGATLTHRSLVRLARNRSSAIRLVTTNFDRIFLSVASSARPAVHVYEAPLLPIPKSSRWNGIVHLHGLLPRDSAPEGLNRLIVTSGDFGLAYLTERWAARFVSELFRNYVVCFVGYSINDPVLRYMMDALAADRMLGEVLPQAYAMGDYRPGQEMQNALEWEAKGVKPILYEVPTADPADHSALHRTLRVWADVYDGGTLGVEQIVVDHAMARPSASTKQDDFVGRLLWALSHETGLPAKRFAEFNPVPPLDWLQAMADNRYAHRDLSRFGVQPRVVVDNALTFSLVRRPTPYALAPWMTLVHDGVRSRSGRWDFVMEEVARWLMRHMGDPALLLWMIMKGGDPHDRLIGLFQSNLTRLAKIDRDGNRDELDQLRRHAPSSVPGPLMRTLWRLFFSGRIKTPGREVDLYSWNDRLTSDGPSPSVLVEFRAMVAPRLLLRAPLSGGPVDNSSSFDPKLGNLFDWEISLAADHVYAFLGAHAKGEQWKTALPLMLEFLENQLVDALDMQRELGVANDCSDRSFWDLPSITPHWQNRGFRDWVALIELLRDSWLAVRSTDSPKARAIAVKWFAAPYATFKRLAFFAASQSDVIDSDLWVDWLLTANCYWLWNPCTKRETLRLLVLQGSNLTGAARVRIEAAITAGPFKEGDLEFDQGSRNRLIWLWLAKLARSGAPLGEAASDRLAELSHQHPEWKLSHDEQDEFSHWMSGTGDPGYEDNVARVIAPQRRKELVSWLRETPDTPGPFHEDTWTDVCRRHFLHAGCALRDLSAEDHWPIDRWAEALLVWSDKRLARRSWRFFAALVDSMPDKIFCELAHSVSVWIGGVSHRIDRHSDVFLRLCGRLLDVPDEADQLLEYSVTRAINSTVGHATGALLTVWFKRAPNDNEGLPEDLIGVFTRICDLRSSRLRHGRVLLSSRLIAIYRVDPSWTQDNLLPCFDWGAHPDEARAVWPGFLWSPRLYWPLLLSIKEHFLGTARRHALLGEFASQFTTLLTYAALRYPDGYSGEDFAQAFDVLPQRALDEAGLALVQAVEGAGEQRENYWKNQIRPFWHAVWPKSTTKRSPALAETLARLAITARGEFPSALELVRGWLQPTEQSFFIVHLLSESKLASQFPEDALSLLNALIGPESWPSPELATCLAAISEGDPRLRSDSRFQRLRDVSRSIG